MIATNDSVPSPKFQVASSKISDQRAAFNAAMSLVSITAGGSLDLLAKLENHHERLGVLFRHAADLEPECRLLVYGSREQILDTRTRLDARLASAASFAMCWAQLGGGRHFKALVEDVWMERERQRALFRVGRISFLCESPIVDPRRKFTVLAEEVGEVAQAIDQVENHDRAPGNLHAELIQVAAVAAAWIESLQDRTCTAINTRLKWA